MAKIDTTFTKMAACKIQPLKAKITDTEQCTRLGIVASSSPGGSIQICFWYLISDDGMYRSSGRIEITGADYKASVADKTNLYPFTYVGGKLGLIFID